MPVKMIEDTTEDTQTDLAPRRTHDRDDDQKTIDQWTKNLATAFDTAGKPSEDSYAGPTKRFATDDSPDAKRRVARAFALINHDRQDGDKLAALWFKNSKPDGDGYVTVKYGVRVMPAKEAEQAHAAETATESGNGQPSGDQPNPETPPFSGDQPSGDQPSGDDETGRGFRRGRR